MAKSERMRSELVTLMAPQDEAAFLAFVFANPDVALIPSVRNPTPAVPSQRSVPGVEHLHCMLWNRAVAAELESEHIPSCNDYYLRSDEVLIQYLRSPVKPAEQTIGVGRIALATEHRAAAAWYTSLVRWLKAHFRNTFVYASDFKPDIGSRERTVWAGPHAIALSRAGWKLRHNGPAEYSLRFFEAAEEQAVLARYRAPRNLLVTGKVVQRGELVDAQLMKHRFRLRLDLSEASAATDLPLEVDAVFSCASPIPGAGDDIACIFNENILGRLPDPWLPRELRKLTAKGRAKTIASLNKAWKI